jgi:hypothetical protein
MEKEIRLSSVKGIVGNRALVQARLGESRFVINALGASSRSGFPTMPDGICELILVALLGREIKRESKGRLKKTL